MKFIIIGAGVAGLATAGLLARAGHQVTLLESNDTVGGRAGSLSGEQIGADPGFRWDTGPSWYLMPEAFDRFFELMGTTTAEQLDLVDLAPGYRVLSGTSDPVDVPVGEEQVAALFESLEPGAGREVRRYLDEAGDTYRIAVDRFLYTNYSSPAPFLGREVLARAGRLVKLLTGSLESLVNKRFSDTRTRQILSYPAVFLSSAPAMTPALYQLMSYTDLVQGVKYPLGGFTAVVESLRRLAEDNGVEIRTSCPVARIRTDADHANPLRRVPGLGRLASWLPGATTRATGVVLADGTEVDADAVVSAADLHHTETALLAPGVQTYPEAHWKRVNPGVGAIVVMLGVRGELPQLAHHTLLFSEDWTPDFAAVFDGHGEEGASSPASSSVYVCRPSATDPDVAPEGHENLFVLVPCAADTTITDGQVDAIADATIDLVAERAGIPDLAERICARATLGPKDFAADYNSWHGWALGLAHTLTQSAFMRGTNRSRAVSNLYYAGSTTTPGVGVPMCLISAENVLTAIKVRTRHPGIAVNQSNR
ncbi:MAG TPA: phytoene desaturase [Candidatus Corynebacterium avicola]|uniref:Phytoene desaturase n=1 Tax=Candidatus Corynebacterium avicola TaxID=2838527 RepID=A0A9D1ULG3_9CORY|nr:phytoene desaturase [Candidatus Corynebacterium avicola]